MVIYIRSCSARFLRVFVARVGLAGVLGRVAVLVHQLMPDRLQEAFAVLAIARIGTRRWAKYVLVSHFIHTKRGWLDSPFLAKVHGPTGSLVAHFISKDLQDSSLVAGQVLGHGNLELNPQIAHRTEAPPATQLLHTHSGQSDPVTRASSSGYLDLDLVIKSGDGHFATQQSRREWDRGCVKDVGARAAEAMVRGDSDGDIEVTTLSARPRSGICSSGRRITFTADSHTHAILNTSRNINLDGFALPDYTVSAAATTF